MAILRAESLSEGGIVNYLLDAETATADLLSDLFPGTWGRPGHPDELAPVLAEVLLRHLAVVQPAGDTTLTCGDRLGLAQPDL